MKSLKAIIWGSLFIIICMLLIQLAYLFIAVGYHRLVENMPMLQSMPDYFRYLVGLPVYLLVMMGGGYVAAEFAEEKVMMHGFVTGVVVSLVLLLQAQQSTQITLVGYLLAALSIAATTTGSFLWRRGQLKENLLTD